MLITLRGAKKMCFDDVQCVEIEYRLIVRSGRCLITAQDACGCTREKQRVREHHVRRLCNLQVDY
jgi:hypothetical protein